MYGSEFQEDLLRMLGLDKEKRLRRVEITLEMGFAPIVEIQRFQLHTLDREPVEQCPQRYRVVPLDQGD